MKIASRAPLNLIQANFPIHKPAQCFHTPDSSGKPLSEAKSLERIAGNG